MLFYDGHKGRQAKGYIQYAILGDSDKDFESVIKSECIQDLPKKALYVLKVIFECKVLVKYVKKVSLSL